MTNTIEGQYKGWLIRESEIPIDGEYNLAVILTKTPSDWDGNKPEPTESGLPIAPADAILLPGVRWRHSTNPDRDGYAVWVDGQWESVTVQNAATFMPLWVEQNVAAIDNAIATKVNAWERAVDEGWLPKWVVSLRLNRILAQNHEYYKFEAQIGKSGKVILHHAYGESVPFGDDPNASYTCDLWTFPDKYSPVKYDEYGRDYPYAAFVQ